MNIGVTGANGFVGGHTLAVLKDEGHFVRALVRQAAPAPAGADETARIPGLGAATDVDALAEAFAGLDMIVHLANRAHVMSGGEETLFMDVNVEGSARVLRAAHKAGVRRLIFLSSVKAVGERSHEARLTADTPPAPEDAYGRSKLEAERRLCEIADETGIELVILRAPLVYGWPPTGNLAAVVKAVGRGVPLPLAGIRNRRDMIYVGNLASAIAAAVAAPALPGPAYFLSDGVPVSTPDLFRAVGRAFGKPARLFYLPLWALRLAGALTGRGDAIDRLTGNLEVDSRSFHRDAGWQPPYNMDDGLRAAAQAGAAENRSGD